MSSDAQIHANQANSQLSTGPITEEGKQTSARNNFRHGLASGQLIVSGESQQDFDDLLQSFLEEHAPATPTESALVAQIAQHFWLGQRALSLQSQAFANGVDEAKLALYLRYQTTHNRAFHASLQALLKLRKDRFGFESQKRREALVPLEQSRNQELHSANVRLLNSRANHLADCISHYQRQPDVKTTLSQVLLEDSLGPAAA